MKFIARYTLSILFVTVWFVPSLAWAETMPISFADLVDEHGKAVVNISSTKVQKPPQHFPGRPPFEGLPPGHPFEDFNDLFEFFRGGPERGERKAQSLGSGFVIDPKGYIVTNNHVIDGADEIIVTFDDDTEYEAEIIGTDKKTDLAVLKIEADKDLPYVIFGDSDHSRVGDWVVVIGNPFGLGGTVTAGIISARARDINAGPFDDFIQTDAPINRGNSGGPMFNMDGKVIGISTAIFSPNGVGSVGIGFAIPSGMAKPIIDQLKKGKDITRGWLGVKIQKVTDEIAESLGMKETEGALVAEVIEDSPAEKAGLKAGDIILSYNGHHVSVMKKLPRIVAETEVGQEVKVIILRDGKQKTLTVDVARMDDSIEEKMMDDKGEMPEDMEGEPVLGMYLETVDASNRKKYRLPKGTEGALVIAIEPGSAAMERGLMRGDVIVKVNHNKVTTPAQVEEGIEEAEDKGRKAVLLLVQRSGDTLFVAVPLED